MICARMLNTYYFSPRKRRLKVSMRISHQRARKREMPLHLIKCPDCPSCDFTTTNAHSWQNHRRNHEEPHRHWCYQCNYSTDSVEHLEIHLSGDHDGFATAGGASPVPSPVPTRTDLSESDDFNGAKISSSESTRSISSDSSI